MLNPWPYYSKEEIDKVRDVVTSGKVNYWTGDEGKNFEVEFAKYIGCKHAIALANGTLALELALKSLNIGTKDEVIVTPRSFIASISCVVAVGATPVFADIDAKSGNLSADTVKELITEKTKAVICVHIGGNPCDLDPIMELAQLHNFYVIEDCAQAHGAEYHGRKVGSIGHVSAFSFCQDKIMSTLGEGGMLTTNDSDLWKQAWAYKDHGKDWDTVYRKKHPPGYRWLHESFGSNYRMTEVQAAVGRIQLKLLDDWVTRRTKIATSIIDVAGDFDFLHADSYPDSSKCAFYRVYLYVKSEKLPVNIGRDCIQEKLNESGVPCFVGSCSEVYNEKAFDGKPYKPVEPLPNSKKLGETSLCFLTHPTITDQQLENMIVTLKSVLSSIQD